MNASSGSGGNPPGRHGISGLVLTVLFLLVAGLLFYGIYLALPQDHEFSALLLIGSLSLVFALGCNLLESASRDPAAQRSLAWGFLAMGFATLFLSVGLGPTYQVESAGSQIFGLIVLAILLGITIALVSWRLRAVEASRYQEAARESWRHEPPASAFSYPTANSASVPATAPPPRVPGGTPPSGGGP
jgi:Zn-dependent protease with chaperone function